ncbi:hypothetical protein HA051_01640 [Chromobacterium vaccinii]|nr:hypothetical protein [Chromobacterium vaccinii]
MNIEQIRAFPLDFVAGNQALFGGKLALTFAKPLQAVSFADELHRQGDLCDGLYRYALIFNAMAQSDLQ